MPIITYPLNGISYDATDAETYLSTRKSGIFSAENNFGITISGGMGVIISPGLAWVSNGTFKGKSIACTEPEALTIPTANGSLPRRDLIVLRFDASENRSYFAVKSGTPSTAPALPTPERSSGVYELGLYGVYLAAGAISIKTSDITSLLMDENYCGLMRDGVTGIPTQQLQDQATEIIMGLIDALNSDLSEIVSATVTKDLGDGHAYCDIHFEDDGRKIVFEFHNIEGADGVSVTHTWSGNVLTIHSASGETKIDFNTIKYYKELVRFTSSGSFDPAAYPTKDGTYDVIMVGGGGSGAWGSADNNSFGGESGGIRVLSGLPLISGVSYPVVIGAGGSGVNVNPGATPARKGNDGGKTSFAGFSAAGGKGGVYSGAAADPGEPTTENGYTHSLGTTGSSGRGGDSLLSKGGANNYNGAGKPGSLGSGGGACYKSGNNGTYYSGDGGDGVVIIRGWVGGR